MSRNLPDDLRSLIVDAAREAGAQVYDIEFNGPNLQVFIDSEAGVPVDLCRQVSGLISARLDQADLIPGRYYLEISSPGLERKLRGIEDFRNQLGKCAHVVSNRGAWDGVIKSAADDTLVLAVAGADDTEQDVCVPVQEIKRANLRISDDELFARKGKKAFAGSCNAGGRVQKSEP